MTGLRRRVALAAVALLAVLAAGCGVRPSVVITGGPAPVGRVQGVGLYFVAEQRVTLVLRPSTPPGSVDAALALLLAGPDPRERQRGYRSEIPAGAGPAVTTSDRSGTTVSLGTDVTSLSARAVDQLVCTVRYALPADRPAERSMVTLTGPDGSRGPYGCDPPECPAAPDGAEDSPGADRCLPADPGPAPARTAAPGS
ncbi:hypothetical protein C6361_22065 [Plantactinospora sp. BC1]|uniref:hypothetical protein n=1 Tax=Plantactinospora sp. BC1 TaxID=2108470 RepID=UPI000D171FAC|nr:hypothetical protein [Plantactinospora sp. BC1]AVT31713.1 hypothetical protein C6361_22065 [Plantactinospora sp. BC1]